MPTQTRYVLLIKVVPGQGNAVDSQGWKVVGSASSANGLALALRAQSPYLKRILGEGLLLRVEVDPEGDVDLRPVLHSTLKAADAPVPRRLPRLLEERSLRTWEAQVARALAEADNVPGARIRSGDGRRRILPTPRRMAAYGTAAAMAAGIVLGVANAFPTGPFFAAPPTGQAAGMDADLAEGGTVRRLQGVAQALGRRY